MNTCKKCFLPDGRLGVRLNKHGICNFCEYHQQAFSRFAAYREQELILQQKFELFKGKYEYDVLVGLSGGKDSTYVLYRMVKKYHLKVLAVTFDNGFLTDYSRRNVEDIVKHLKIDHFYYKPNWEAMKIFYRACLDKLNWPCFGCIMPGFFLAARAMLERKIPFFVHGRTPFQLFRNFYKNSSDPSIRMMELNLQNYSAKEILRFYRKMNFNTQLFLWWLIRKKADRKMVAEKIFKVPKLDTQFVPEMISYFLFEKYDEESIKDKLEKEHIGYKRPSHDALLGHGDCEIHEAAKILFKAKHNVIIEGLELAVMLRHGEITPEEAKKKLEQTEEDDPEKLHHSIGCLCTKLDLEPDDYNRILHDLKHKKIKSYWKY